MIDKQISVMKTTRYVIIFLNDIIEVENPQKIAQSSRSNKKNFFGSKADVAAVVIDIIEEKKFCLRLSCCGDARPIGSSDFLQRKL